MGLLVPRIAKPRDEVDRRPTVALADIPVWRKVRIAVAKAVFQRLDTPLRRGQEVTESWCNAGVFGENGRNVRCRFESRCRQVPEPRIGIRGHPQFGQDQFPYRVAVVIGGKERDLSHVFCRRTCYSTTSGWILTRTRRRGQEICLASLILGLYACTLMRVDRIEARLAALS